MILESRLHSLMEEFKIPFHNPFCPEDWKDWYHYVLYDPKSRVRILYNICFNGKPGPGYVTDTLFVTVPKGFIDQPVIDLNEEETFGFARNRQWEPGDLTTHPLHYKKHQIDFRIISNVLSLRVENKETNTAFHFHGAPISTPVYVPEPAPYGRGFIGWGVMAGYQMSGHIQLNNRTIYITDDWYCYHDRNFGRFNWGNIGWTWFVISTTDHENVKWAYVLHQSNNSDYTKEGAPILFTYRNDKLAKVFIGDTVRIQVSWSDDHSIPPILPGSMASLFSDRNIRNPKQLSVYAQDELHTIAMTMDVTTHTELIVPDSEQKAYTFIKELSGEVKVSQNIGEKQTESKEGFFYAELCH